MAHEESAKLIRISGPRAAAFGSVLGVWFGQVERGLILATCWPRGAALLVLIGLTAPICAAQDSWSLERELLAVAGLEKMCFLKMHGPPSNDISGTRDYFFLQENSCIHKKDLDFDDRALRHSVELARNIRFVREFVFDASDITSLEPLRGLIKLKTLSLNDADGITSLEPLRGLPELQNLSIRSGATEITSLEPLQDLNKLKMLSLIDATGVINLEPLRGLPALASLNLANADGITSLEPLRSLHALTWLDLSGADGITDLAPLRNLPLQRLTLSFGDLPIGKGITTLAPLKGMDPAIIQGASPELLATMR